MDMMKLIVTFCYFVNTLKNVKIKIYRTIILCVVWYGCEIWSLTMREECKLRVFKNWVLRRIFGPKTDKVTRDTDKTT
jgi:hypothetical protein